MLLVIDTDEDISDGLVQRMLSDTLGMYDVVREIRGTPPTETYHRGAHQIDGAWVTDDLSITRA